MPRRLVLLSLGLISLAGLTASPALAQPADSPFALHEVSTAFSYSGDSDLDRGGKVGSTAITHYDFSGSVRLPAAAGWRLTAGLAWSEDKLTFTGDVPLPDRLQALTFNLSALKDLSQEIGPGWSFLGMLRPGLAAAAGDFSGDSFALSAMAAVGRRVSPDLAWNLGVMGSTRGQYKVLPVAGITWTFAPDWTLAVGFPRTGVSYQASAALRLNTGVSFHGGSYHVGTAPAAGLGDTWLDYREFRVSAGAEYAFTKRVSGSVDAGVAIDRSFDYRDRGYELDGKSAGFVRVALNCRF